MKLDVGYTHSTQSAADITIDDADYLAWCRGQYLTNDSTEDELLKDEETIIDYLNYDKQFLSGLIGWGETDTIAFDIDFK